jgi:hypothetical protein
MEFFNRETIKVGDKESSVVFLEKITVLIRVADYILNGFTGGNSSLWISTHLIIENYI